MAKKAANSGLKIIREEPEWGVRLRLRPFPESQSALEVSADIKRPKAKKKNPEILFWFSAVPVSTPLRATEMVIWRESCRAIEEAARKAAETMK